MSEAILNELKRPRMLPQEYVQSTNTVMGQTSSIPRIGRLHSRIKKLYDLIYGIEFSGGEHPRALYVELDTLLFELKALSYLLSRNSRYDLEYEPIGDDRDGKTVDVKFLEDAMQYLVEFKATNPKTRETRIPVEHFSADAFHSNEMYYNWISSARSHLLEFLIDAENRLANYPGKFTGVLCVYKNFYVEEDELESLWHFYVTGTPHAGDAFGAMMEHELEKKGMRFSGSINELWALPFPQYGFELDDDGFMRFTR